MHVGADRSPDAGAVIGGATGGSDKKTQPWRMSAAARPELGRPARAKAGIAARPDTRGIVCALRTRPSLRRGGPRQRARCRAVP